MKILMKHSDGSVPNSRLRSEQL